jgi:hypothetical protein
MPSRGDEPPGATVGSKTDEIHGTILKDRSEEALRLLEDDLSPVGACDIEGETPGFGDGV